MDINTFGSHSTYKWTHEHLMNVLSKGHNRVLTDPLLINAFKTIKRQDFVPENQAYAAYEDKEIPIGYDQTTARPTVTASMINQLKPQSGKKYLDIGAGSGYASALLGLIAGEKGSVYSLERNQYLADFARENISKYKTLSNVETIFKDGSSGLAEKAPYDFIYCEVAFEEIPNAIKNQLVVGGRLVAPTTMNDIRLIERISPTEFDETIIGGYVFKEIESGIE